MAKEQNMYLKVDLANARSALRQFKDARFSLTTKKHGLAALAALESFIITANDEGWEEAVANIPVDNPNTPEREGTTLEELNEESSHFFNGKDLSQVTKSDFQQNFTTIRDQIINIVGQQYSLDVLIGAEQDNVNDLTALLKADSPL